MKHPLKVHMVGGITVVNADGSQETVHGALLQGDLDHPEAIQTVGALLYREVVVLPEHVVAGIAADAASLRRRLSEANAAYTETVASLATDLATIEAVLDRDPDAVVEEGEVAARVLALRDDLDSLRQRVADLNEVLCSDAGDAARRAAVTALVYAASAGGHES